MRERRERRGRERGEGEDSRTARAAASVAASVLPAAGAGVPCTESKTASKSPKQETPRLPASKYISRPLSRIISFRPAREYFRPRIFPATARAAMFARMLCRSLGVTPAVPGVAATRAPGACGCMGAWVRVHGCRCQFAQGAPRALAGKRSRQRSTERQEESSSSQPLCTLTKSGARQLTSQIPSHPHRPNPRSATIRTHHELQQALSITLEAGKARGNPQGKAQSNLSLSQRSRLGGARRSAGQGLSGHRRRRGSDGHGHGRGRGLLRARGGGGGDCGWW